MIAFPQSVDEAVQALAKMDGAQIRAGATDLQERRELGLDRGPLVDLRDVEGLDAIEVTEDGGLRIGAGVTVMQLQHDPQVQRAYPGLARTARGLATPQIRARATVGGNLLQAVRCWYWRNPAFTCLKRGGSTCLARAGEASHHACVDLGPCIAAHPSTLAVALLALDARAEIAGAEGRSMAELLGAAEDPKRTHTLEPSAVLTHVVLPPAIEGWQAAYKRTIQRSRSEWPIVEAYVGVKLEQGVIREARVALGGIANRPMRAVQVEKGLAGMRPDDDLDGVLSQLAKRAGGIAQTAWKIPLIAVTLRDTLVLALEAEPATAVVAPQPSEETP